MGITSRSSRIIPNLSQRSRQLLTNANTCYTSNGSNSLLCIQLCSFWRQQRANVKPQESSGVHLFSASVESILKLCFTNWRRPIQVNCTLITQRKWAVRMPLKCRTIKHSKTPVMQVSPIFLLFLCLIYHSCHRTYSAHKFIFFMFFEESTYSLFYWDKGSQHHLR